MNDDHEVKTMFNLANLKRQLEIQNNRAYQWKEMSERTGRHVNTLINLAQNNARRVDLDTLDALIEFFAAEGMTVTYNDLLVRRSVPVAEAA